MAMNLKHEIEMELNHVEREMRDETSHARISYLEGYYRALHHVLSLLEAHDDSLLVALYDRETEEKVG